jgi:hypothetical protein
MSNASTGGGLGGVDQYMRGIADAMAASIRQNGDLNSTEWVQGTKMTLNTCVHVRCAWLSFHASKFFFVVLSFHTIFMLRN